MKRNNLILIAIVALLVGGAVGFFGGMQYQKSQRPSFGSLGANGQRTGAGGAFAGRFGAAGGANGARPVTGQIISTGNNSVTVKMSDGSTKIVLLTSSTSINKTASASQSDLITGQTIAAFGTQNSDGSLTASNVELNPQTRGFGRPSVTPGK